ncbi:hypothetical protein ACTPEF_24215 [Clostridioides difficile]
MKDYREDNERFDKDNCSEESSCEERECIKQFGTQTNMIIHLLYTELKNLLNQNITIKHM